MGTWIMEVCKMGMYMTFPVALFHIFNQPAYFEKWVTNKKRELYPPESLSHHAQLQAAIRDHQAKHDAQMMQVLEDLEMKSIK